MSLVIPDQHSNWRITINNVAGGLSARSSVSIATKNTADLTQTDVNRIANLFRDGLKVCWDNQWSVGPVHVNETADGSFKVWDDATTEAGTATANTYLPPAPAYVVSKNTGFAGRSQRGRLYLPGVQDNVGEDGVLDTTDQSNKQTAMTNLLAAVDADASVDYCVLLHDEETSVEATPTRITSFTVRSLIGTMRPRMRR